MDDKKNDTCTRFEPREDELFFTIGDKEHCNEEAVMAKLLIDGVIFVGDVDTGPFFNSDTHDPGATAAVWVNCGDTFELAYADCEPVRTDELGELYRFHQRDPIWGSTKWCVRRRNVRPHPRVEQIMRRGGHWEGWMDALEPVMRKR